MIDSYCVGKVSRAIEEWNPQRYKGEREYQRSLIEHLRAKFPKADIVPDYGAGASRVDFGVTFHFLLFLPVLIFIELKANLKKKSDFQRLRGQILEYAPKGEALLVVLCGDTNQTFIPDIRQTLGDNEPFFKVGVEIFSKFNKVFLKP